MKKIAIMVITALGLAMCTANVEPQEQVRYRTIITTDGEVDDMDSFIRMLLYSNDIQLEGLIYSSSQWHYSGDGKGTLFTSEMPSTARRYGEMTDLRWPGTTWMQELIDKYAVSYPNLVKHDSNYPTPEQLKSLIKVGNIEFEGEMEKDTEGSKLIEQVILDDVPGQVYMQIWGGTNTVARALKSIKEQYGDTPAWPDMYKKICEKVVIYAILDQDATYVKYVAPNWPDIKVIYNSAQFWSFAYQWTRAVPEQLKVYMDGNWYKDNIKFNHGPLLENYYLWGDGQHIQDPEHTQGDTASMARSRRMQYDFISEGDSPSYFYLLDFGLRSMENMSWGGIGGRFVQSTENPNRWEDGRNVTDYDPYTQQAESAYPQVRWVDVLQNDFAARADWCINDYDNANHRPVASVKGKLDITAKAGSKVSLKGVATDPDGDTVNYSWWQYVEAGTYDGSVEIATSDSAEASLTVPEDAAVGDTIHIILQVKDGGVPALSHFQRVIVTVG